MRIEWIEVINLDWQYPDSLAPRCAEGAITGRVTSLVRVTTDTGMVGIGSAYSHPDVVRVIVEGHLRPHLVGMDPLQVETIWDHMYALTRWYGRMGAAISALGAVDIALWDLRGKALGVPVFRLLGGARAQVPVYASGLLWHDDMREIEAEARRHRANGFGAMKMRLGRNEDYDSAALVAAARGAGKHGRLMVDGTQRYTMASATALGRVLKKHQVEWFEEPFAPEDVSSLAVFRELGLVPTAAGENEFGLLGFAELFRLRAVDVAQPDASRTGGITEMLRIAAAAERLEIRVSSHSWSDAVAIMANAHVVAAVPNGMYVEVDQTGNPFVDELLSRPLEVHEGMLVLPEEPGLGVDLDEEVTRRLTVRPAGTVRDGNYADLVFGAAFPLEVGASPAPPASVLR